jgi:hypothetical protein
MKALEIEAHIPALELPSVLSLQRKRKKIPAPENGKQGFAHMENVYRNLIFSSFISLPLPDHPVL